MPLAGPPARVAYLAAAVVLSLPWLLQWAPAGGEPTAVSAWNGL